MKNQSTTVAPDVNGDELFTLKSQIVSLTQAVERLRHELGQQSQALDELTARLNAVAPAPAGSGTVPAPTARVVQEKPVTPDILVIISAAVTAFLGKKVRIRSARMLQSPYEIVNPWSQQGRVSVQASHMLRRER